MRTRQEIIDYLGLEESYEHTEELISTANEIESKYEWELKQCTHGYGLACDFESIPHVLEDPEYCEIKKIETINGITVYEILNKEV